MDRIELTETLRTSRQYQRASKSQGYYYPYKLFAMNYRELKAMFNYHTAYKDNYLDLRRHNILREVIDETTRRTYNFIQSAQTLVYHTRSWYRRNYKSNGELPSYLAKINSTFAQNPLHHFIIEFRNVIIHDKLIILGVRTNLMSDDSYFLLEKELLLKHIKNHLSRKYLDSIGDEVNLEQCFSDYFKLVTSFYQWLEKELKEFHTEDWEYVNRLQNEIDKPQLDRLDKTLETVVSRGLKLNDFEANLLGLFTEKDWSSINILSVNSRDRARAILQALRRYRTVDEKFEVNLLSICS